MFIYNKHFERIVTPESNKCIYDRCILDAVAYAMVSYEQNRSIDEYVYDYGLNLFYELMPKYDIVFYTTPEFDIIGDGVRNIDETYRLKVDEKYKALALRWTQLNDNVKIVPLCGSVNQRIETIFNNLV